MPRYEVNGILLEISNAHLSPSLKDALKIGKYERQELFAIRTHLRPDDTVLEVGTGIGYLAIEAARVVGGQNLTTVEANPKLFDNIRSNFALNGIDDITLLNFAVLAGPGPDRVRFHIPKAFHAASLHGAKIPFARKIKVNSAALNDLLVVRKATVLICDAEGAEVDYFFTPLPAQLRLIILEVHPRRYGEAEIEAIFTRLAALGFRYELDGSKWPVVCFLREDA